MTKKFTMQTLTNPLAHGLIRDDAKNYFVEHLEQIYDIWIPLLEKTTLQPNEASDDSRLGNAFKALRQHIVSPNLLKSRLGAVQLTKLMVLLKGEITTDHGAGRIAVEETSKSIAIDAYLQACGPLLDRSARDQALKWVSMSKRWHDLTRGSPLLAVIHSPKAEHVVSDTKVSNKALIQLGIDIRDQYPSDLVDAADYLTKTGESGVQVEEFRGDHLMVLKAILGQIAIEDL